jgi:hypothetical protein
VTDKPRVSKAATRAVFRNLSKETALYTEAWESFSLDTVDDFSRDAKSWLGDKSELRGSTIETADYAELLVWFRYMSDRKRPSWKPVGQEIRNVHSGEVVGWMVDNRFIGQPKGVWEHD